MYCNPVSYYTYDPSRTKEKHTAMFIGAYVALWHSYLETIKFLKTHNQAICEQVAPYCSKHFDIAAYFDYIDYLETTTKNSLIFDHVLKPYMYAEHTVYEKEKKATKRRDISNLKNYVFKTYLPTRDVWLYNVKHYADITYNLNVMHEKTLKLLFNLDALMQDISPSCRLKELFKVCFNILKLLTELSLSGTLSGNNLRLMTRLKNTATLMLIIEDRLIMPIMGTTPFLKINPRILADIYKPSAR